MRIRLNKPIQQGLIVFTLQQRFNYDPRTGRIRYKDTIFTVLTVSNQRLDTKSERMKVLKLIALQKGKNYEQSLKEIIVILKQLV